MSLIELRSSDRVLAPVAGAAPSAAAVGRRAPGDGGTPWSTLAAIAVLAAAALAAAVGVVVVNGDGVWHLVWGRALADGTLDSFATGPTPHPSLLLLGAAASPLGDEGGYLVTYVLFGPLAFGLLAAAVFEVARRLSSRWAGAVAVLILATSTGVVSIAGAARYDVAFAALVMSAVALEMARPRRGVAPLACLAVAGLVRPEAWAVAGVYLLWAAPALSWPARARAALLAAAAPALWMAMDALVTGDPLYSLHVTDRASAALYGQFSPGENLHVAWHDLVWYLGALPLLLLAPAALLLLRDRPRGALPPLAVLAVTLGVFLFLLSQGMASSERYLLVPACVLAILAAMAVDGGGRRTPLRVIAGVCLALVLSLHVASRSDVYGGVADDSAVAQARYESAQALVGMPGVRDALQDCPSVSLAAQKTRPWFAYYSGRAPEAFVIDGAGRTRPDLYVAPANPAVAKAMLTRPRFDTDASFRVPRGLAPGLRNADWVLYVSRESACTRGLR